MELVALSIPYDVISSKTRLSWREVLFGLENQLLALDAPVDLAGELVGSDEQCGPLVVELAGLEQGESARPYVERLAAAETPQDAGEVSAKWLYLVLAWIYENKSSYSEPLQQVECVYADFGYPEEIADFVGYMPSDEPNLGRELNEERLYKKWKAYLDQCSAKYVQR